ncbi:MAG: peptide chain release factor 1 [Candidatus Peregrinibacteria bacterium Greene0416_19]|nr:MAG: peptide chain release factor 1 [Candidatus Peregrinibacteria bacterium Greene0416_19]
MIEKLRQLAREHAALNERLFDPAVHADPREIARIGKRIAELEPVLLLIAEYERAHEAIRYAADEQDSELRAMAEQEAADARARLPQLEDRMKKFLLPNDPDDDRGVIIEVRAGTGGEEAALFAAELLRMYLRFAEERRWKTEMLDKSDAESGGIKEASCRISSSTPLTAGAGGAYGLLKYESGVHRVQRIPSTENKGRVHTSTATVAILPEAEEVDIRIRPEDLRIDTYRASGAGGQHVNKTESAVRITHLPTGVAVACQTERSQLQNRVLAMSLLRSRLYAAEQERLAKERGELRSGQIGSGDRSEKIRTYNFPQDRLTDHRLERNFSNLPAMMEGGIGGLLQALREKDQEEKLARIAG